MINYLKFFVKKKYERKNFSLGKGLLKIIEKGFYGDIKKLLQTIVGGIFDPAGYFSTRIREAVKGLGLMTLNYVELLYLVVKLIWHILSKYIKEFMEKIYMSEMILLDIIEIFFLELFPEFYLLSFLY